MYEFLVSFVLPTNDRRTNHNDVGTVNESSEKQQITEIGRSALYRTRWMEHTNANLFSGHGSGSVCTENEQ